MAYLATNLPVLVTIRLPEVTRKFKCTFTGAAHFLKKLNRWSVLLILALTLFLIMMSKLFPL